jgi:hypothetical protein
VADQTQIPKPVIQTGERLREYIRRLPRRPFVIELELLPGEPLTQPPQADAVGALNVAQRGGITVAHGKDGRLVILMELENDLPSKHGFPQVNGRYANGTHGVVGGNDLRLRSRM